MVTATKEQKKKPSKKTIEAELNTKLLADIEEHERLCQQSEIEVLRHQKELKSAKELHSGRIFALRQLICARDNDKNRPLLNGSNGNGHAPKPPKDDPLRCSIDELALGAGLTKTLREVGMETVGKIGEWTSSGKKLTDLKGVGEKAAEKLIDSLDKFWESHPQAESKSFEQEIGGEFKDRGLLAK